MIIRKEQMNRSQLYIYIKQAYGTDPEFLWQKYPNYAVFRHDNHKWYAIVMNVSRSVVELTGESMIDILNLKLDPSLIDDLRMRPGFVPGYHMNKIHWVSIILDSLVADEEITDLLDMSYQVTK